MRRLSTQPIRREAFLIPFLPKYKHPAFHVWSGMLNRCYRKSDPAYKRYGGRGIKVCPRWRHNFYAFVSDVWPPSRPGLTIERIDNNKGYSPRNCKWATRAEQCRNRRSNVWIRFQGRRLCIQDWATELGVTYYTLYWRYVLGGWSAKRTLTTPSRWA